MGVSGQYVPFSSGKSLQDIREWLDSLPIGHADALEARVGTSPIKTAIYSMD